MQLDLSLPPCEWQLTAIREAPASEDCPSCSQPGDLAKYWRNFISKSPVYSPAQEFCYVILLNTQSHIQGHHLVAMGTLDHVIVHPRDIFRPAVVASCFAICLAHNHPSSRFPSPSKQDREITKRVKAAGEILGIPLLDHIIIGKSGHYSFRENIGNGL